MSLYETLEKFKDYVKGWGWAFLQDAWVVEGAGEKVFYSVRDWSNTVPTYAVEEDINFLLSKISRTPTDVKTYGMILLSPTTTGPAEKLAAEHSEKVALIEVDMRRGRGKGLTEWK